MHLKTLRSKSTDELREMAGDTGGSPSGHLRRHELLVEVLKNLGHQRSEIRAGGVLEVLGDGFGFLRFTEEHYHPGSEDIYVSPSQIRRFTLRTGDAVEGVIRAPKEGERYLALLRIDSVNGLEPDSRPQRHFEQLRARPPAQLLTTATPEGAASRLALALAPLGRGQRCVITGPPAAGAALMLELAHHLAGAESQLDIVTVLLDARPEVADVLTGEAAPNVVAALMNEPPMRTVQLADMALCRARRLVELGRDVVVSLDSLSALEAATSAVADAESPAWAPLAAVKSLLAAAHACEGGGSLTLITTVGMRPSLAEQILGYANMRIAALHLPGGALGIDPHRTATEDAEGIVGGEQAALIGRCREVLGQLSPAAAAARAIRCAQGTSATDELRRALEKSD